jgi:hypothetical protein
MNYNRNLQTYARIPESGRWYPLTTFDSGHLHIGIRNSCADELPPSVRRIDAITLEPLDRS